MLFHIVEDCFVVTRSKGLFRQAKVFRRGDQLFAGVGAGFVRLIAGGYTTIPAMSWDFITPHPNVPAVAADVGGGRPRFVERAPLAIVGKP